MVKLPELLTLWWLEDNLYHDDDFVQKALEMMRRVEEQKPDFMRSTYSPATAITGLFSYLLNNRLLPCYFRGNLVDDYQALEPKLMSLEGDIGRNIEAANETVRIKKAELVKALQECGLPIPHPLLEENTVTSSSIQNTQPANTTNASVEPDNQDTANASVEPDNQENTTNASVEPDNQDTANGDPENWKMKIQAETAKRWRGLRASSASPTLNNIAPDLVKWCAEQKIRTKHGVIPSSEYIRKHVIGPKYWTPPTD